MTTTGSLQVTRAAGALGAEVRGLSLAKVNHSDVATIEDLLTEHLVLFFPDQHLTAHEHLAFGRHFGPIGGHPNKTHENVSEHPEIFEQSTLQNGGGVAEEWHSDLTCEAEPSVMAILQMLECPAVGGDTMWANMYLAFEEMSPPMRELCEGLTALHDAHTHNRSDKMTVHPVVRVHPVTGRKSLFVNSVFTRRIVEMSAPESDLLLGYLMRWVTSPRFTVRYHWSTGTVAMWDNRCTQHSVLNDFDEVRIVQRVTVMGDKPVGNRPRWEPFVRPGGRQVGTTANSATTCTAVKSLTGHRRKHHRRDIPALRRRIRFPVSQSRLLPQPLANPFPQGAARFHGQGEGNCQ